MDYRYDENGIAYDYSGLSAIFDGSDFEETAYKLVKDIESKYVTETHNLWDATNAATKKILRDGLWCDAKTLYEDLKAQGHDWDKLLQTRGHWTFDQYTNPVPFLSTMDLLYMRKGLYTPYWY
jgi:hypothetical protein